MNSRLPSPTMSLPAPERVVIIGGGIMGVCTAYYLSRAVGPRASITLIEGTSIAAAASGRAGGLLALDWWVIPVSICAES